MYKYLFITYGEPGWRGVQIRALRMAKYLPKGQVLFWNSDDSQIIKDWGFDVKTIPFGLVDPEKIVFPRGLKAVIFADLPSNKLYNLTIFNAANKKNISTIICEQVYRRNQMQEGVYKKFLKYTDLFILNSLSFFKGEESNKIKIVPPQIEVNLGKIVKKEILTRYDIPKEKLIIFGVGYHKKVYDKIVSITKKLEKQFTNFTVIVSSPHIQKVRREGNLVTIPLAFGDDFFKLIYAADLVMVKFGFLQILEALALRKPTIVLGEGGYVLRNSTVVDSVFQKSLHFDLKINEDTFSFINKFLSDQAFRKRIGLRISKLHNGKLFGAREAVKAVKKVLLKKKKRNNFNKRLALLVNDEIFKRQKWINEIEAYPLCFVIPARAKGTTKERISHKILAKQVASFQERNNDILPSSFRNFFILSERKYDGFMESFDWYDDWIAGVKSLLDSADEIFVSSVGQSLLEPLLDKYKKKLRLLNR